MSPSSSDVHNHLTSFQVTSMLTRPRFRPHLHVEVIPGEGVFVLSGARQALLQGRLYELVVPCLNGATVDDLCDVLHEKASPAEIFYTLSQLESKKYLCEDQDVLPGRTSRILVVAADRSGRRPSGGSRIAP